MDERLKKIYTDVEIMFAEFLATCPICATDRIKVFVAAKQSAQKILFELANANKDRPDPEGGRDRDRRMRDGWKKRKVNT